MTIELTMLAWSVGLLIALVLIQAGLGIGQYGAMPLAGPRDNLEPAKPLVARARRVVDNHREGLTIFAPLVLIAAVAGVHSDLTRLGAQMFFWSRLAHAGIYLAGLPAIRPLAWAVGLAGTLMVLAGILSAH